MTYAWTRLFVDADQGRAYVEKNMIAQLPTTPAVPPFLMWGWRPRAGGGYIATCRSCWTDYRVTGVATEAKLFEQLGQVLCRCQRVRH